VASFEQHVLGKPGDHERALQQLLLVQGKTVSFFTALCVLNTQTQKTYEHLAVNEVRFRTLSEAQLDAYLRLEQPYDCAGSAKSEGLGIALIEAMHGDDPNALVGLPLIGLVSALQHFGYPLFNSAGFTKANV
jgi:septum formation protein